MNSHKNSVSFLATADRGSRRAVFSATLWHRLDRCLPLPVLLLALAGNVPAQVNSGSDGHDGAFNPTTNTVINMADHSNGIYQYTSINIPSDVTVTFIPNANNSPVVWLVQSNCVISGQVIVDGQSAGPGVGASGGPGGYAGGSGGSVPTPGQGPGGGSAGTGSPSIYWGSGASYGSLGSGSAPGPIYGNTFLLPLVGGSGGGGSGGSAVRSLAGGGGGGAILIAASNSIQLNGGISAGGTSGTSWSDGSGGYGSGAGGSGGAVRLIANIISGTGSIITAGGYGNGLGGGLGRIRFDTYQNSFGGSINGVWTQGFQPIIIPTAGQGVQLAIASVGGVAVAANPSGVLVTPDAIIAGQQANPIAIVVHCSNLPLNTPITVTVRPANGSSVSAVGLNNTGTQGSSTATVSLNMPRGGGILYATAATGN